MQASRQRDLVTGRQGERSSHFCLLVCSSACLLVCIIVAGCESGFGSKQSGDPLLGIHSEPKPTQPAGAPSSPAMTASTSGPLPPMPSSYTSPGTAPMASGEAATPENPRALRITGDPGSPAPPYPPPNGGSGAGAGAARGAAPTVTVGNPEPTPAGATANFNKPPSSPPSGSIASIRTYEDALQYLRQHGVTWQRMSQDDGEWKFSCGIPNPSNPRVNKTYQTIRPFPDLLSAMLAVIAQIEQTPR